MSCHLHLFLLFIRSLVHKPIYIDSKKALGLPAAFATAMKYGQRWRSEPQVLIGAATIKGNVAPQGSIGAKIASWSDRPVVSSR